MIDVLKDYDGTQYQVGGIHLRGASDPESVNLSLDEFCEIVVNAASLSAALRTEL
jgi:hypothetical protein